jgi:hypothetical protein
MKIALACIVAMSCGSLSAAPAPPVKSLLRAAHTVLIARVVSTGEEFVTVERVELLRGSSAAHMILRWAPSSPTTIGLEVILLSHSDGLPEPTIGFPIKGLDAWRGWVPLWVVGTGDQARVHYIGDATLREFRQLVQRNPYEANKT